MKEFAERLKQLRSEKGLSSDGVSLDYLLGLTDTRTPADLLAHRRKSN